MTIVEKKYEIVFSQPFSYILILGKCGGILGTISPIQILGKCGGILGISNLKLRVNLMNESTNLFRNASM